MGALTRTVRDSAVALDQIAGPDLGAPYHAPPAERPFGDEVGRDPPAVSPGPVLEEVDPLPGSQDRAPFLDGNR